MKRFLSRTAGPAVCSTELPPSGLPSAGCLPAVGSTNFLAAPGTRSGGCAGVAAFSEPSPGAKSGSCCGVARRDETAGKSGSVSSLIITMCAAALAGFSASVVGVRFCPQHQRASKADHLARLGSQPGGWAVAPATQSPSGCLRQAISLRSVAPTQNHK